MANELYRTYEVLVEESVHEDHPKRVADKTSKGSKFNEKIDAALRDTHTIFQDAVCYYTLLLAGLAGNETLRAEPGEKPKLLNPLWKHLTTPEEQGGINEETERVIRRLATHYAPLKELDRDAVTAEDFVNLVYSQPLQILPTMTEEQRTQVNERRAACYHMMEDAARNKKTGELNCEGMGPFAKTWTGLLCVGKKASIPSELPYARFSVEVRDKITAVNGDDELTEIFDKAIEQYRAAAQSETERELETQFGKELTKLQQKIAKAEALPKTGAKRQAKIDSARKRLEEFQSAKQKWIKDRWAEIRVKLPDDVKAAVTQRFLKQTTAKSLALNEEEFEKAKREAESVVPDITKFFRFREPPVGRKSNREAALFRYLLLRDHPQQIVRSAAIREFRAFITKDAPAKSDADGKKSPRKMPFLPEATYAFRFFGKQCLGLDGRSKAASSPCRDLDVTAFQTAIEDVFKYKIRTEDRTRKVARILNVVSAYEGEGSAELPADMSPTGKTLTIRGMKGDLRWKCDEENRKGIAQLLDEISSDKDIGSYGLREGTIGGWAEVRKRFLQIHAVENGRKNPYDPTLIKDLETAVDEEMNANRQGFGSADFFHALCQPEYHHLWLEGANYAHNGIKDFIPHYVTYCEYREDLIDLLRGEDGGELERSLNSSASELRKLGEKPIRYTWPGLLNRYNEPSYRYYDFTAKLDVKLRMRLFRRIRPEGDPTRVERYELIPAKEAELTLAARRLKRDKILNKNRKTGDWSSVDALWCPPLILEGEPSPAAETKPIAGKKKKKAADKAEVSFSLIAIPLPGDYWNTVAAVPSTPKKEPVHLTVSFKIEGDETAKLRADTPQWTSGSLRGASKKGEQDDRRRHFKWPIDLETSKFDLQNADEKPKELWCGKGRAEDGWKGFTFRHDGKKATYHAPDFQILSVDLGNRFAAAFARLRIHADAQGGGRVVSAEGFLPTIKADVVRQGTLRLQGEDAELWQLVTTKNKAHIARKLKARGENREPVVGTYEWVDEKFGNGGRGRFPTTDELAKFSSLAHRLVPNESLSLEGTDKLTYPELGDHLIFRLKRRIGRLRTLFNLAWRLSGDKEKDRKGQYTIARKPEKRPEHLRIVIETLARSAFLGQQRRADEAEDRDDTSLRLVLAEEEQWNAWRDQKLLEKKKGKEEKERRTKLERIAVDYAPSKWLELAEAVKAQIANYCEGTDPMYKLLVEVIEFCLPLRGRHWGWDRSRKERLNWDHKDEAHVPRVEGMRGLSLKRLEQILNIRQRCQSFAKLEDRYYQQFLRGDFNPPDSKPREEIDDVCPLLLERSNRIREQRVRQTAHLILAEALGMELKNPADVANKKQRKSEVDLHGEYKRRLDKSGNPYPRCSVIVLENLERYRTSQERTKTENSRLMKWAHRAIIEKLEDMCRPFGITLMLVDPAFSSRFDARNGLPGVRVMEVSRNFHKEYPFSKWMDEKTKSGTPTKLANDIKELVHFFEQNKDFQGALLLAVEGGKEFLPVLAPDGNEGLINADINAAINIGLRAVADPQLWDVFPRVWTKRVSGVEVRVTNWRGWFGKFKKDAEERIMRAVQKKKSANPPVSREEDGSESSQSTENPPFFVHGTEQEWLPTTDWLRDEAFQFQQDGQCRVAYPQGAFLKRVEQECTLRIKKINDARIRRAAQR